MSRVMWAARVLAVCGGGVMAMSCGTEAQVTGAPDAEVLALREAAWRAYFAGETETLAAMLPQEFIGISMQDEPFTDRRATLAGARRFLDGGGRLVSLSFPETRSQRYGDTVILYGRFEVVLSHGGVTQSMRGRLTEVFVKHNGRWVHPGWHLDVTQ